MNLLVEILVRAVIYISTSSETQGKKSSPLKQETVCQRLAQENGLTVIRLYRNSEKYEVGNKLVELFWESLESTWVTGNAQRCHKGQI